MSKLQMKPTVRNELTSMDLSHTLKNAHRPNKKVAIIVTCIGLAVAIIPWIVAVLATLEPGSEALGAASGVGLIVSIIGVVFVLIGLIGPVVAKKHRKNIVKDLERIEKHHGGIDKVVMEVKAQLANKDSNAYTIESGHHLTADWLISVGFPATRIVKLSDIVAIIGIMGAGTFIVLSDGEQIDTMFGKNEWGETFDLFTSSNPYILYNDDEVTMANGKVVDAETAWRKKDFASITQAYLHRKQNADT